MVSSTNEFSRPVVIEPWPDGGIVADLTAEAAERRALARRFDLLDLGLLRAGGRLERTMEHEIRFSGWFEAEVVQTCVLSLEPVPATLRERFERRYRRVTESTARVARLERIAPDDEDEAEIVTGATIDLGEAVAEELALALDPYPRAPDAERLIARELGFEVESEVAQPVDPRFAVLQQLQARAR